MSSYLVVSLQFYIMKEISLFACTCIKRRALCFCFMLCALLGPAPAISRLGINPYQWGTECLSGDVDAGPATSFPMAIGMVCVLNNCVSVSVRSLFY